MLAYIADIIVELYAVESVVLRAEKFINARGAQESSTPIDITRTYSSDAADRIEHPARQVVAAVAELEEVCTLLDSVRRLTRHRPYNTVPRADASATQSYARDVITCERKLNQG